MADVIVKGIQGEHRYAAGTETRMRTGSYGEQIVNDAGLGRYFEVARLGRLFTTYSKAVTVAATHNSPLNAVTATPVIGVQNPPGNNKAMVLVRFAFGTTSGTPAGGNVVLNVIPAVTTLTTAAKTGAAFNHLAGGAGTSMSLYNNVALTALAPVVAQEMSLLGDSAAAAAAGNSGPGVVGEDLTGQFIIPPSAFCAIMAGNGAGTSWIVSASLTWVELDWPL